MLTEPRTLGPSMRLALLALLPAYGQELNVAPYLQDATPEQLRVLWETTSGEESRVLWGPTESLGQESSGSAHATSGAARVHSVLLEGLSPDTPYYYQVVTGSLRSEVYSFRTPPDPADEAPTRLVAMSDMQRDSSNPDKFGEICDEGVRDYVEQESGEALVDALDMLLIPGDLVTTGTTYSQWSQHFFGPAANLLPSVPVYPVLGNHEYDTRYYFDYFQPPDNGTPGYEEHWWWLDHSNVRVIGLDSNSGYRVQAQLDWLDDLLDQTCEDAHVDFVFAQLHHPHLSELWLDGEINFTGEVIDRLEAFSTRCNKPSIHFFGHTHGYSRGQSRDHSHLWVNVASAGGNLDYWGEYAQRDYAEFSVSEAQYGFVTVDVEAGDDPLFVLSRVSRGDESTPLDNALIDRVTVRRDPRPPETPTGRFPTGAGVNPDCFVLQSSEAEALGAAHWQVAASCEDFSDPLIDAWEQHENRYGGRDLQADADLTAEEITSLEPESAYCWRVRYRSQELAWSAWSEPLAFETGVSARSEELLGNGGAEDGTTGWEPVTGPIESIADGECDAGGAYAGGYFFALGGVCADEGAYGEARQEVDVSAWADAIDAGELSATLSAAMRSYNGTDVPAAWLTFLDGDGAELGQGEPMSESPTSWTLLESVEAVPAGARRIRVSLSGTRNGGTDNDSYFDAVSLRVGPGGALEDCQSWEGPTDTGDTGGGDSGPGGDDTDDSDESVEESPEPKASCACAGGGAAPRGAWAWALLLLGLARARRR